MSDTNLTAGMSRRGGKRPGAGRKKGSVAVRHAPVISDADKMMPLDWLIAVLRDPQSEPGRRDAIAIAVMPYLHPRLNAVSAAVNVKGEATTVQNNTLNIFAVPRGASVSLKDGTACIEGAPATDLPTVEPFEGTPAIDDATQAPDAAPAALPVQHVDTSNVTRLKRPGEPGEMVQRVFDALANKDTRRPDGSSDTGAA